MEAPDPISRTQRVVLVIDLDPLLKISDPSQYLTSILASARTILNFSPLSSSLFSFKLFFSSLSPILSSSKIPNSSLSLSFDFGSGTLDSLARALDSMVRLREEHGSSCSSSSPRASFVASSLRELVLDYGWEVDDPVSESAVRSVYSSNLVVLFSPIGKNLEFVSGFLGCGDGLREKFLGLFGGVKGFFDSKDIHLSWVDVKFREDDGDLGFGGFGDWVRDLGWGFCSSDFIVLGSAVVPFGLIYPKIGVSPKLLDVGDGCGVKVQAQLSLDILDVNGKNLECKCCDLEMVGLKNFHRNRCGDVVCNIPESVNSVHGGFEEKNVILGRFRKIHVKAVHRCDEFVKIEGKVHDPVILRECKSRESGKRGKEGSGEFVVDRVLEMVATEMGEFVQKSVPIWKILLSFLCRENCWALVSVSDENGSSCVGILKPFTVSSAFLSVIDSSYHGEITKPSIDARKDIKRRRNKKRPVLNEDFSWSAFCKLAFEHAELNLEEVYFEKTSCNSSKKLKFLKCWMKQVQKSFSSRIRTNEEAKQQQDITKDERLTEVHQESERPISASAGDESLTGASRVQDEVIHGLCSETPEAFFSTLPEKIQQGIESEGVDLGALVERLVKSSIYWLCQKCETEGQEADSSCSKIAAVELMKLLLREPKEMAEKHKNHKSTGNAGPASEHIVREYEIQILFRMEILRSEVGAGVTESTKSKFVRHICLLLENVQCHLEGGFFGDWSLDDYVGKIVKSRYVETLGDIVHKIYTKMDLLLFAGDEDPLPNSEESNQSQRNKPTRPDATKPPPSTDKTVSEEDESPNPPEEYGIRIEEHARRTKQARERRERARRFSSSSTWAPDLLRVWAPKQQKAATNVSNAKIKVKKTHCVDKASRRGGRHERVCETPLTGRKRPWGEGSSDDDEEQHISGTNSSSSVPRSLFQDDWL